MKDVDIGLLRPATPPKVITEVVDIGILRLYTLPLVISKDMILVLLLEKYLGHNRSATVPLKTGEK